MIGAHTQSSVTGIQTAAQASDRADMAGAHAQTGAQTSVTGMTVAHTQTSVTSAHAQTGTKSSLTGVQTSVTSAQTSVTSAQIMSLVPVPRPVLRQA